MAYVPAPGYQPAFNPPIPYTTMIAGGLREGMVATIQATLPSNYNRFSINFTTGQEDKSDNAFHFNARYDGRDRVIFNSKEGEVWGNEEMKKEMPFKSGKVFFIMFEITRNNYRVFANGAPFYEFPHRIPLDRVNWLRVLGDITVQELAIIGSGPGVKGVSINKEGDSVISWLRKLSLCPNLCVYIWGKYSKKPAAIYTRNGFSGGPSNAIRGNVE